MGKHMTNELLLKGHDVYGYGNQAKSHNQELKYKKIDVRNIDDFKSITVI